MITEKQNRYDKTKKLREFYDHIQHIDATDDIRVPSSFCYICDNYAYLINDKDRQYVLYYIPLKHEDDAPYYAGIVRISLSYHIDSLKSLGLDEYRTSKNWISAFHQLAKRGIIDMHIRKLYDDETSIKYIMKPKR